MAAAAGVCLRRTRCGRGGGCCVCVSSAGGGDVGVTVIVTEDGVERALAGAGAGVTRGAGATDAARALLRVSGGAETLGCCCGEPGGNGTRGCCVMGLLLYF